MALPIDHTQKKILSLYQSNSYASLLASIEQLNPSATQKNIFRTSRSHICKALHKVLEKGSALDSEVEDKTLHQLRISLKKLRYICEFYEPLFSRYICLLDPFIEKTKDMQNILGDYQDAITGISMLTNLKKHFSSEEFSLIKKKYELKKKKNRQSFLKIWKDYWIGPGFRRSLPNNGLELILEE